MIRYPIGIALSKVPVNKLALTDDTDFKTRETSVAYNAAGMDLVWNFMTPDGNFTQTAVTPTSGGLHDWSSIGDAFFALEIPKSGGTINNDTVGTGFFSGVATGVLPWAGPEIEFVLGGEITGASPTTTTLVCSGLTSGNTDQYSDPACILFLTGTCAGAVRKITGFTPASDTLTFDAMPAAPAQGDIFIIINGG